jgi:hypothetical protein
MSCPTSAAESAALLVIAGSLLVVAPSAHAQGPQATAVAQGAPTTETAAAAQALFVEGRRLVIDGRYLEGCAKLEQSQRLDPAPGTQINLADCYEKSGRLASAWLAFHDASASAQRIGRLDWANQARERAQGLELRVPHLTIVVDDASPGLAVRRDGALVESSTLGSPVPVDPGAYEVAAFAPLRRPWSTRVVVEASTHVVLHVPVLAEECLVPPKVPAIVVARPKAPIGPIERTIALGLAAVAVVPIALGSYFGVVAITRNDQATVLCPTPSRCTAPQAIGLIEQARRNATAANVAFGVGAVLFASAGGLFLLAPKDDAHPSVAVECRGTTVALVGGF